MACTRHCALASSGGGRSHLRPLPMWLLLELYGAAVVGTLVPSFSLLIVCTHRWVRGLRDTAVSALLLDGTIAGAWHGHTRVHRLPIACPAPTLVVRRQFQQHIVDMTRVWRNSVGARLARLRVHSPRGCHSCGGHGIVRRNVFLERVLTRGSSSFGSSAAQPFTGNLCSTRSLARS